MPVPVNPALDAGTDSETAPQLFALRVRAAFNESRLAVALILPVVALAVVLLWAKVEHWRLLAWGWLWVVPMARACCCTQPTRVGQRPAPCQASGAMPTH